MDLPDINTDLIIPIRLLHQVINRVSASKCNIDKGSCNYFRKVTLYGVGENNMCIIRSLKGDRKKELLTHAIYS